MFLETYSSNFDNIIITFTDQNDKIKIAKLIWNCLLINRNDTLFYRTKNKKICQQIYVFVICDYWALPQKKELDCQKIVHKAAETTDEFNSEQNCETKICTY